MPFASRPDIDALTTMTPSERLDAIRASIITDPAELTPELSQMVEDGWSDYDAARQASPRT